MNTDFLSEYLILASDGSELSSGESATEESTASEKDFDVTPTETILLGVGTVFVGLIAIIIICKITGYLCNLGSKSADEPSAEKAAAPAVQTPVAAKSIDSTVDRGELAAAICAAIAEETGTDAAGIRILSIKKV